MLSGLSQKYKQIFADVPNKEDKKLRETLDRELFYRELEGVFHIPDITYIEQNLSELPTLQESFNQYYQKDGSGDLEVWDLNNISHNHYSSAKDVIDLYKYLAAQTEIAIDIETTGFSITDDRILLIVFCWGENEVATVDNFSHTTLLYLNALLQKEDIKFIWHNGKFDIIRLKAYFNIEARIDEDTMLMHYIGFNVNRGTHGLGYLAMLYLQAPNWEKNLDQIRREVCRERKIKQSEFNYGMFPKEDLISYAYYDGLATYRLFKAFESTFPTNRSFIYYKLVEASNTLANIELRGAYVDQNTIKELDDNLSEEYEIIMKNIAEMTSTLWLPEKYMEETGAKSATELFNPRSPQQLRWMLRQKGFNVEDTAVGTLEKLDDPLVDEILEMRKNDKYRRTYVRGLKGNIDGDGRIHTNYNLHGTVTGRLSSSNPNLQNIPRDRTIKNIFTSTPGKVLVQADYSQAELRVLAVLSGDPWLQNVYKDGKDLHDQVAREYWGDNFDEEDRTKAKAVNFGIAYGRTAYTLSPSLGIPLEEAEKLLTEWFDPMPYVKKYFDDKVRIAYEQGITTTPFNRYREFIITPSNKFMIRNEAMNTAIQGTASDLTLFSLIEIEKELQERDLGGVVLTVHDSIIAETEPQNVKKVQEIMVRIMNEIPKRYLETEVPFEVDIDIGERWGDID